MKSIKKILSLAMCGCLAFSCLTACACSKKAPDFTEYVFTDEYNDSYTKQRVRTVISTDGEDDDMNSFVRMLLYSNEFDIKGLNYTSSKWHWAAPNGKWLGTKWMQYYIDRYAEVYDSLILHDINYPSPDYLKSLVTIGNIKSVGDMSEDTDGSNQVKALLLDENDGDIYLQCWGGTNTYARALKSIEEEYNGTPQWNEVYEKVCGKTVLYIIQDQDDTYKDYIKSSWKDIRIIYNTDQFDAFGYEWVKRMPDQFLSYFRGDFMPNDIKTGHGELLNEYYLVGDGHDNVNIGKLGSKHKFGSDEPGAEFWGLNQFSDFGTSGGTASKLRGFKDNDFISEGDDAAFLLLIDNGLRSLENASYGGWGGRFAEDGCVWKDSDVKDQTDAKNSLSKTSAEIMKKAYPLTRWAEDIQLDFSARADWCTGNYASVNHAPTIKMLTPVDFSVGAGYSLELKAQASDPDGNDVSYKWWQYVDAGSAEAVNLIGADTDAVKVQIPHSAQAGQTIHLILEVRDIPSKGLPSMVSYRRVIITVK